jgi:type II secretory pathway component PulK
MAIMLMAIVAVALAALTSRLGTAARIARAEREEAQVRQLLLAGVEYARAHPHEGERAMPLPEAVMNQGASVKITTKDGRSRIEARVGKSAVTQTVEPDGTIELE